MTKKKTTQKKPTKRRSSETTRQLELVLRAMVLVKERVDHSTAEVDRLQKFFGPVIDGTNPPLDGAQVASKAYVDDALARLARVIRSEMAGAK